MLRGLQLNIPTLLSFCLVGSSVYAGIDLRFRLGTDCPNNQTPIILMFTSALFQTGYDYFYKGDKLMSSARNNILQAMAYAAVTAYLLSDTTGRSMYNYQCARG